MSDLLVRSTITLPAGFTSVDKALPDHDRPVLAIRKARYVSAKFEVLTARYQPGYRPLSPWRRISNDSVHDDGEAILGWCEALAWLHGS